MKCFLLDLLDQGYLYQSKGEYPVIYILEKAKNVLAGSEDVVLKEPDPELARKLTSQKGESSKKDWLNYLKEEEMFWKSLKSVEYLRQRF